MLLNSKKVFSFEVSCIRSSIISKCNFAVFAKLRDDSTTLGKRKLFVEQRLKDDLSAQTNALKKRHKGSFINDVTALGGRGYQGLCDDSNKVKLIKSVTIGEGVLKISKLLDVIYE